jgi:hypothetical protein
VRSACTVPHAVPVFFREAHVGRCPGALPGLPGGSGNAPPILAHSGGLGTLHFPHASRVSWSDLLGSPSACATGPGMPRADAGLSGHSAFDSCPLTPTSS